LTFTGDELRINATPGEDFRVELQTELGEPIPGFAMKDCTPITGDGTDQLIRWGDKDRLKEVAGRRIRLHFAMIGGSLYSFRFA
jgi:hypothetical protein